MAIQGVQSIDGVTLNGTVTVRLGEYDGLEGISNPSGWQQGDGIEFGTTNNYYTDYDAIQAGYESGIAYTDASIASATGVGVSTQVASGISNFYSTLAYNSGVTYTNSRSTLAATSSYTSGVTNTSSAVASAYTSGVTYTDTQIATRPAFLQTSGIANDKALLAYNSGVTYADTRSTLSATLGYNSGITYANARSTLAATSGYTSGVTYTDTRSTLSATLAYDSGLTYSNTKAIEVYNSGTAYADSVAGDTIINNTFTGGAHVLTTMLAGNDTVATGTYNRLALQSGLTGFSRNILQIPGGVYYIQGSLDSGLLNNIRHCYIDGLSPDHSWQLHEAFPSNDKRGTTLVFQGMTTGDIAINFPCTRATGNNDLHGPYVFKNIRIETATGSALQIGHANSVGGAIGSAVTRGVQFDNLSVSLVPQYWTNSTTGFLADHTVTRENARIDRTRPQTFGVRLYGPYDLTINNCAIIGGHVGLDIYEADFPIIDNVHYGHQFITARHTTRAGRLSVGGVWTKQFIENAAMCGLMLDRGSISDSRFEFGYTTPNGHYNMYAGVTGTIVQGGGRLSLVGLTGGRTPYDYFELRVPISMVDSATNRKYFLQPTGFDSSGIYFANSGDISYINRNITGTTITRYYGTTFIQDVESHIKGVEAGYNAATTSGCPIGFIIPGDNRGTVTNFGPGSIGVYGTGNQVVVLGHNRGTQFRNTVGVDWFGGNNILMPINSPLADIWGYGQYDANACSYIMGQELSIPDRKWVAAKGQGSVSANSQSRNIEIFKSRGRMIEDWSKSEAYSQRARYVQLIGLETGPSISLGYAARLMSNGGGPVQLDVNCENIGNNIQFVRSHTIGTGWGLYTGTMVATGFSNINGYATVLFNTTGSSILCESIIIKRLDENEVFTV